MIPTDFPFGDQGQAHVWTGAEDRKNAIEGEGIDRNLIEFRDSLGGVGGNELVTFKVIIISEPDYTEYFNSVVVPVNPGNPNHPNHPGHPNPPNHPCPPNHPLLTCTGNPGNPGTPGNPGGPNNPVPEPYTTALVFLAIVCGLTVRLVRRYRFQ